MTTKTKKVQKRLINSAKTNSRRVHITPRQNGWAVRKEGNLQASRILTTQKLAIEIAKEWVDEGNASAVIIHGRNGKFRAAR
ncbi:MAG: DUF2188 domain-containing protein [Saprospiraceae bacterium]|nr:DUF2188 domain-containing protein [Bacteroidia bacterium]NNE15338.1 DUF2188 domain-containing protein [Saprospiraceae bacterium]